MQQVAHPTFLSCCISILVCVAGVSPALGQAKSSGSASIQPLNRFPRMVQEYFVDAVGRVEQRAEQRRDKLKTAADAEAY
ncbi:MAG TPA: hypothetical protein VMW24_08535, partial [Sedimentisphaerales bacterium]|nr:hypothetical protein [Sedimentisphaerales bacterium]